VAIFQVSVAPEVAPEVTPIVIYY